MIISLSLACAVSKRSGDGIVRAERFEVLGEDGRPRIVLGVMSSEQDGKPDTLLRMYDDEGNESLTITSEMIMLQHVSGGEVLIAFVHGAPMVAVSDGESSAFAMPGNVAIKGSDRQIWLGQGESEDFQITLKSEQGDVYWRAP